ncbi:MAG: ABC transporter substrate-binding protein [Desulfovibrio sp.]|nr:ABC transporter substrate-binding protein [Desulfovibrio sp.]
MIIRETFRRPALSGRFKAGCLAGLFPVLALWCLIPGPAWAQAGGDPVRIAVIYDRTGEASVGIGERDFRGAALAVAAINASGGLLGRHVELLEFDNAGTTLGARHAAKQAVAAGVLAVVGGPFSGMSKAIAEVCQEARTPFVASIATHADVTRAGDCAFRICFTDDQQWDLLARFALQALGARKAAVLVNVGSDYSMGLAATFTRAFQAGGGDIVLEDAFKTNDADFSRQLTAVAEKAPDVVFVPSYALESGRILRQAKAMGITATFLGGDGWGPTMIDIGGAAVRGHYYTTHWHPEAPFPAGRAAAEAYRAAYGESPFQPDAILAHDAVMVLADAVRRAGTPDREKVIPALARTRDFPGGTGTITFDENRNPIGKDVTIMRFTDDQAVFHATFR